MFSLESDEMTVLWPNDSLTFTFYVIISNSIPNQATFVKEVFSFDVYLRKWPNDGFLTNDTLTFTFYMTFLNSTPNWTTFVK